MTQVDRRVSFGSGGYQPAWVIGWFLIASGTLHLGGLWWTAANWEGPVSWRKPGLFGVSSGLTVFSLIWVVVRLRPQRGDLLLINGLASALCCEVMLITMQFWRGVPSHFNRATVWDATVETTMLGLILIFTLGVGWLSWRAVRLPAMASTDAIALRWGLAGLMVSCVLGMVSTFAGDINIFHGRSPDKWGESGVLKFPHGALLHAIQVLPLLAMAMQWLRIPHDVWLMRSAVVAHVFFLGFALRQTFLGRARFDCDGIAITLLLVAGVAILMPFGECVIGLARWVGGRRADRGKIVN